MNEWFIFNKKGALKTIHEEKNRTKRKGSKWGFKGALTNLIGSSCYWHGYRIFIPKSKSQPHILLLMLQRKCRGVIVLYHCGSFQPKHWISNSTQVLR